jgi:hypothetical protein
MDAFKVNPCQCDQKGMPPRITYSRIKKLERLWLKPTFFYKFEMRKNQRAILIVNPVLYYKKS